MYGFARAIAYTRQFSLKTNSASLIEDWYVRLPCASQTAHEDDFRYLAPTMM